MTVAQALPLSNVLCFPRYSLHIRYDDGSLRSCYDRGSPLLWRILLGWKNASLYMATLSSAGWDEGTSCRSTLTFLGTPRM